MNHEDDIREGSDNDVNVSGANIPDLCLVTCHLPKENTQVKGTGEEETH